MTVTRTHIAHGAFRLWHTFSSENLYTAQQGTTRNLMDYNGTNSELYKYQWDYIHNPQQGIVRWMVEDEESEALKWNTVAHWKTNPYFKELNEKNIYLQYAEEQQKYNHTIPTSIRIFDKDLAKSIFGFEPKFVNYDFLQDNDANSFHPRYFVPYETNR